MVVYGNQDMGLLVADIVFTVEENMEIRFSMGMMDDEQSGLIRMVEGPKLIKFSNVRETHFCFELDIIHRFICFGGEGKVPDAKCVAQPLMRERC